MEILSRMTAASIRLLPSDPPQPRSARVPTGRARRWRSPLENDGPDSLVSVFVTQRAFTRLCAHAAGDLNNEVGGWLVGKWRLDRRTGEQFIIVEAGIPAAHTRHGSAYLTFTQATQLALYDEMRDLYPDKELVGWYHTHPRMGVFLSSYDVWLHGNFFPEPYQVALVIEPHSGTGGFFVRDVHGRLDPRLYYGFHELCPRNGRSVVDWRNLMLETDPAPVLPPGGNE